MQLPNFPNNMEDRRKLEALMFRGLDQRELIEDDFLAESVNLSAANLPAITTRKPRTKNSISMTTPNGILSTTAEFAWVDGTDFYFDGDAKTTVTDSFKTLVDYNENVIIFPDNKYYNYYDDTSGSFTAETADEETLEFVDAVVYQNRVWGIWKSELWSSKWGDFKVWDEFGGTAIDSYVADVYSEGDFTTVVQYQNHIVVFKKNIMYELYGNVPENFELQEVAKTGCVDKRSAVEVNGTLFFVSENNVYAYAGGIPRQIGENLDLGEVEEAVAGTDNIRYYVSIKEAGKDRKLYVYDTYKGAWMGEDDLDVVQFVAEDKKVYALTSDGDLYQFRTDGDEMVEWSASTKFFDEGTFQKKYSTTIRLNLKMDSGSWASVYLRTRQRGWKLIKTVQQSKSHDPYKIAKVVVGVREADKYQIKIAGKGYCMLYGEREFIVGGDY